MHDRARDEDALISPELRPETEVQVLIDHKEILIKKANVFQHAATIRHRSSASAKNHARLSPGRTVLFTAPQLYRQCCRRNFKSAIVDAVAFIEIEHLTRKAPGLRILLVGP